MRRSDIKNQVKRLSNARKVDDLRLKEGRKEIVYDSMTIFSFISFNDFFL